MYHFAIVFMNLRRRFQVRHIVLALVFLLVVGIKVTLEFRRTSVPN